MNKKEALELVRNNGLDLIYIPKEIRDKEIYLEAVKENGWVLEFVPEELRDKEICLAAVKNNGCALQYIPKELKTKEMCLNAIKQNIWLLNYIPKELIDKDIYLIIVEKNVKSLKYIPDSIKEEIEDICFKIKTSHRSIYVLKLEDGSYRFSIGCQKNITKEEFINRIYHDDEENYVENALDKYPYRQEYLDILENY